MHMADLPADSTGDALRRLIDDGADLHKPHEVDFHIATPDLAASKIVGQHVERLGFRVSWAQDDDGTNWTVWCTKTMIPSHGAITAVEEELDAIAQKFGGWVDGWGAFPVG